MRSRKSFATFWSWADAEVSGLMKLMLALGRCERSLSRSKPRGMVSAACYMALGEDRTPSEVKVKSTKKWMTRGKRAKISRTNSTSPPRLLSSYAECLHHVDEGQAESKVLFDMSRGVKRGREDGEGGSNKRAKFAASRRQLPIWRKQDAIREALRTNNVLVLSGETGSGKSTQLPQYLLAEPWMQSGKIAVTQPRRVAAISLAKRVAEEMGTPCGSSSPASKVGYSVRFDESTSPSTRIKFLTEGMLLQEMLRDAEMKQYNCIVVDEVHERSVNVDLILGFLRGLLQRPGKRKQPLRVVVMSATADVGSIRSFFAEESPQTPQRDQDLPRRSRANSRKDEANSDASWNGLSDNEIDSPASRRLEAALCHVEGRQYPVKLRYLDKPTDDVTEKALECIFKIHCKEPMPGDILVFLTGQETIQSLQKLVEEYAQSLTKDYPRILVLPLFAALPQHAQQRIFDRPPPNTRKVILSTNIAETSVTVPGVRFVVDTGKAKVKKFHNRLGLDSLLVKPISKSSADQRKGRAGREAPGECHRLYTQAGYNELEKDITPEILRCDLADTVLKMKARGVEDILAFPFLTPPPTAALEKALLQLLQLSALKQDGAISADGRKMASLPLTPALARVIIEAAKPQNSCLPEVIDIVAALSVENIFLNIETEDAREKAQAARSQLFRRQGDHLTLLAAVRAFSDESSDRRRWADDRLISHRAMRSVMDVRKQLRAQCKISKLLPDGEAARGANATTMSDEQAEKILRCFLRGFWNNVARLCPDGSYKTYVGNQSIGIHPSSVLFGRKVEAIVYDELVYTNKAWARGVSAVQVAWVEELFSAEDTV